jgi:hypothetical protein
MKKVLLTSLMILTLLLASSHICRGESLAQPSETQLREAVVLPVVVPVIIEPPQKVFTRNINDLELKVAVPSYINLSTPYDKKPARLDIYLKTNKALSGFFSIDVEAGIGVSLPALRPFLFLDIDVTLLGLFCPDVFRFQWPISGIPLQVMNLERGDIGVYALAVPVKEAVVNLENLKVGEWYHIGSYDLYVVGEERLMALGVPTESVIIGEVTSLEPSTEIRAVPTEAMKIAIAKMAPMEAKKALLMSPKHVRFNSKGFGWCSYSDDLVSIDLKSTNCELYPGDILVLKARIEAKKSIYFSYLKLEVYGVKKIGDQRVSCLIGNLTLMEDVGLVRGAVRTEDFELLMPKDVSPGIAYAIVSTLFAEGEKTNELVTVILPGTYLYDVFTIAYLKDKAYEDLQKSYEDLQKEAKKLSEDHEKLKAEFNEYKASHSYTNEEVEGLKKNFKELQSNYEALKGEVGIAKALNYFLITIAVVLIATTAYLAIRRRKMGSPKR